MWYVFWYQSGTGYGLSAGPFETQEEARREPFGRLYPPINATIQVYQRSKTNDHDSL